MSFSAGVMAGAWATVIVVWWALRPRRRQLRTVVAQHKLYDLVPLSDGTVSVCCADCWDPLGIATIAGWGEIAEAHYREKVKHGERPA